MASSTAFMLSRCHSFGSPFMYAVAAASSNMETLALNASSDPGPTMSSARLASRFTAVQ